MTDAEHLQSPCGLCNAGMLTSGAWVMWQCWTWTASLGGGQQSAAQRQAPGRVQQQLTMRDTWCSLVRATLHCLLASRDEVAGLWTSAVMHPCNLLAPCSRCNCSCLLACYLPSAGGHASGGRTNDLLLLELSGWTWSQPTTTGTAPSPRSGAALCIGHGRYLVIHGGRNNFVLDSAHVLDLMTRTWVDVRVLPA